MGRSVIMYQICEVEAGLWKPIDWHSTRREAEKELRQLLPTRPRAFLVRVVWTRCDLQPTARALKAV